MAICLSLTRSAMSVKGANHGGATWHEWYILWKKGRRRRDCEAPAPATACRLGSQRIRATPRGGLPLRQMLRFRLSWADGESASRDLRHWRLEAGAQPKPPATYRGDGLRRTVCGQCQEADERVHPAWAAGATKNAILADSSRVLNRIWLNSRRVQLK